jgi:hypothetical protein
MGPDASGQPIEAENRDNLKVSWFSAESVFMSAAEVQVNARTNIRTDREFSFTAARTISRCAVVLFVALQVRGQSASIFGYHGFRQTQTAWSIRQFLRGGSLIRYETPIGGPPWAIPIELPVYQWVCALLTWVLGTSIEATARVASGIFGIGCIWLVGQIMRNLGRSEHERFSAIALMALSPSLLFWSHSVLLETCSLFFTLLWVERCLHWFLVRRSASTLGTAAIVGAVSGSMKLTTMTAGIVFLILIVASTATAITSADSRRKRNSWSVVRCVKVVRIGFVPGTLTLIVVAATWAWTTYADGVKSQNLGLGAEWTSAAHNKWIYGDASDRLDPAINRLVYGRALSHSVGFLGALTVLVAMVAVLRTARRSRSKDSASITPANGETTSPVGFRVSTSVALVSGLVAFLSGPAIFFRLFWYHDYYIVEVVPYLVIALAAAVGAARTWVPKRGFFLLVFSLLVSSATYFVGYERWELWRPEYKPEMVQHVSSTTASTDVVVIAGREPSVSWALDRRSLLVPEFEVLGTLTRNVLRVEADGYKVGAILLENAPDQVRQELVKLGFQPSGDWDYEVWQRTGVESNRSA